MENSLIIIDKDCKHREFLTRFFTERDCDVTACAHGNEAECLLSGNRFDVAVVDYVTVADQWDRFCNQIARSAESTALIIMNDRQSTAIELAIRQLSPAFYFVKPFLVDNLYAVVLKLFDARDKQRLLRQTKSIPAAGKCK